MEKVNIVKVKPDPNQPRKTFDPEKLGSLRKSIEKQGIISPIIVEKQKSGEYLIVDGERRYRAAQDLGLKEIPIKQLDSMSLMERLMTQFEIQEQHENWTATEKAMALETLSEEMNTSFYEVCEMLSIPKRLAERYYSFSKLSDKEYFSKNKLAIAWSTPITNVIKYTKNIYEKDIEQEFSKNLEKNVEKGLVDRIKSGEISTAHDITKVKDSFKKNPKMIKEFTETKITPSEMFTRSKAQGAYHLRNIELNAIGLVSHTRSFMTKSDVPVDGDVISRVKAAMKEGDKFLRKYGDLDTV